MFWMERENAIGWEGDAYDFFSYLYGSPGPTIGIVINTEGHRAIYDYLSAVVPPPHSNGQTLRDGSMTDAAIRGEALFRGKANCVGCHAGPMTTEGLRLEKGGTQSTHPIVVPSLVSAYRYGSWLVNGAAWTMEEAVDEMLTLANSTLDVEEKQDLVQYMKELTAREFFVLSSSPRNGEENVRNQGDITVTLSHAIYENADNLKQIELRDASGTKVAATVKGTGRHITITPEKPLDFGGQYDVIVGKNFESFHERPIVEESKIHFTVAQAPTLKLQGNYIVTVDHPTLDLVNKKYDPTVIISVKVPMVATSTEYGTKIIAVPFDGMVANLDVPISGADAHFPPFPFQVGPAGFMNRSFPTTMTLIDEDGDGIADSGESTLMFRSPGLEATGVRWTLAKDTGPGPCVGQTGAHTVDLVTDGAGAPTVSWADAVNALGYFVTDVDAKTPQGPGPVTGGTTYWALSTQAFPGGFAGPIAYGTVPAGANDVSAASGAPEGGAMLPAGSCIKLTLVFNDFATTELKYMTP